MEYIAKSDESKKEAKNARRKNSVMNKTERE